MEESLRGNREDLQSVMASISDYLWSGELDSQGNWQNRYYSPATERITGRPPEFYMQGPEQWFSTIHPDDRPRLLKVLERLRAGDSTHEAEYRIVRPDGEIRWIRDSVKVRRQIGSIRIDGVVSDITNRKLSEQELHASESKVRALLETAAQAIVAVDASGRIGLVNATAEKMFGYRREEILGHPLEMLLPKLLQEIHQEHRIEFFSHPSTRPMGIGLDLSGRRKDGTEFPVEVSLSPVEDGDGLRAVSFISDITLRKRGQENSRELAAIVESSDDAIISVTLDGVIASWNGGAERNYGYSAEEMIGRPLTVLIPPDCREESPVILKWIQRGEAIEHFITERLHKDGRRIAISITISPIHNAKQEIIGASSIARDITEQRRAEEALRTSEAKFRSVMDAAPDAMIISDHSGHIALVNSEAEKLYGYQREELQGQPVELLIPERFREQHVGHHQNFVGSPRVRPLGAGLELYGRRKDGTEFPLEISLSPLPTKDGLLVIGAIRDITDRKRAEEELQAKSAALQESQANLQTLSGQLISARDEEGKRLARELHDAFGQNLAVLNLQVSELESLLPSKSDRAKETLLSLRDGIGSLAQQIQQLSRQLHPAVLRELGLEIAVETECANYSEREGINVTVFSANVPEDLPDDIALCLYRVLQESLQNIRKHAQTEEAEVRLVRIENEIVLAVEDSGNGFELKDIRRKGGLGLVSMGERVRTVRGSVYISSRPDQGTLIEVRVPLERR
jgi:PAS domain S-box-containing protein